MLKNIKENLYYYYFGLLIVLLAIIPKGLSTVFNIIPVRLFLLGILVLIYLYELVVKKVKMKKVSPKLIVLYIVMLLTMIPGFFVAESKILFLYTLAKYVLFGLSFYTILSYRFTKDQVNNIYKLLFISAFVLSIYGIIQYIFGIDVYTNGIYKYPGSTARIASTFYNPIYFGIYLLLINILLLYKLKQENELNKLIFYIMFFVVNSISLILTFTRTVAIFYVIAIVIYFIISLFSKAKKVIFKNILIVISALIVIFAIPGAKYIYSDTMFHFLPDSLCIKILNFTNKFLFTDFDLELYGYVEEEVVEKPSVEEIPGEVEKPSENENPGEIENPGEVEKPGEIEKPENNVEEPKEEVEDTVIDASAVSRDKFKNIALNVIEDNKFFGVGLGNYEDYVLNNSSKYVENVFGYPHNIYLHLIAECGIFTGIILVIFLIILFLYSFFRSIFDKSNSMVALLVITVFTSLLGLYESLFYDTQLCPIWLFIIALLLKDKEYEKKDNKKVLFISSVGGHLTQLLQLKSMFKDYESILITEKTDVTRNLKLDNKIYYLPYGSRNQKYVYPFILLYNCVKSLYYFIKINPDVIVTTGANTVAAMCCYGKFFEKKVIYIESFAKNSSKTITGKYIYKLHAYTTFVVQWESMLEHYPKAEYWGGIY